MTFLPWADAIAKRTPAGLACLLLIACSAPAPSSNDSEGGGDNRASGDRLQVVTTFLPITQFTRAVAGDCADVVQLLPSNVGPHDYQAKPSDAQRLLQADVLVQNGLELEQFLEPMIEGTGRESLMIIETSAGLALRPFSSSEEEHGDEHHEEGHEEEHSDEHHSEAHGEEEHDDEHAHDDEHEHDDDHDDEALLAKAEAHDDHDHGEYDPHVWLDPVLAVDQVNNIRDGLIAAAPACEAEFTANAAAFGAQLQELDQEIRSALAPYAGKTFVTYHDFAGYFSDRYQLNVESLVGVPEVSPSPSDIQRVMTAVEASDLKTLLVESEASAKPFEALAQDLDVSISSFSSNELGESNEPEAYFAVMRENVASLQAAFVEE